MDYRHCISVIQLVLDRSPLTINNGTLFLEPPKEKVLSSLVARSFYAAAPP